MTTFTTWTEIRTVPQPLRRLELKVDQFVVVAFYLLYVAYRIRLLHCYSSYVNWKFLNALFVRHVLRVHSACWLWQIERASEWARDWSLCRQNHVEAQIQRRKECHVIRQEKMLNKQVFLPWIPCCCHRHRHRFCCRCYTAHISVAHTEECNWCYIVVYPKQCALNVLMCMLFCVYLIVFVFFQPVIFLSLFSVSLEAASRLLNTSKWH